MTQGLVVAFLVGGLICVLAQLIIELTPYSITPAHILVGYVVGGAVLSGLGWYQPLVDLAGRQVPQCPYPASAICWCRVS